VHQRLFGTTDVLISGAVLGAGSDALHQMMLVFTNFFQSAETAIRHYYHAWFLELFDRLD